MPINDLPKSLIDSVVEVVTQSVESQNKLMQRVVAEGLQHFGVSNLSELSEGDLKAFHAWTQIRLNEASCSCGHDMKEDDMPGDSLYHKAGDEDAEKKKELDEDDTKADHDHDGDGEVETSSAEYLGSRDKAIKKAMSESISQSTKEKLSKHLSDILSSTTERDRSSSTNKILNLMGKDSSITNTKFERAFGKVLPLATASRPNKAELEAAVRKAMSSLNEGVALSADEIATNGAVAVGDALVALPKHADVLHDTDPSTGVTQYRLLLQYATNEGTRIYPPVSLPGAPSVADLRVLVQGLPDFNEAVDAALVHASQTAASTTTDA